MYEAKVRKAGGPWEHVTTGKTVREAKRNLARKAGLPVRVVDPLPLGKSRVASGTWAQVKVQG